MTGFDGKFVIVLDHLADRYGPASLPVSVIRETREGDGAVGQYDGGPPTLISLEDYTATRGGEARLVDVRTGEELPATLYRLTAVRDD